MSTRSWLPPEVTTTCHGPPPSPVVSTRIDSSGPLNKPGVVEQTFHVAAADRERPSHERGILPGRIDGSQIGDIEAGEDVLGFAGAEAGGAAVEGLGGTAVVEEDLAGGGGDRLLPTEPVGGGEAGDARVDLTGGGRADVVSVLATRGGAPAGKV